MFCRNCGKEVTAGAKFCSNCGTAVNDQPAPTEEQPKTPAVERMSNPDGNGTQNSSQTKKKMGLPKPFIIAAVVLVLLVALGVVLHLFGKSSESGSGNSTVPDWVEKIPYWPDEDGIPNIAAEKIPSTTYVELKKMWDPYFEGLGIPSNPDVEYHYEYYANRPDIFVFHQNENICSVTSYEPETPNQPDLPSAIEPVIAKNDADLYYLFYKRDSYYMILVTIPADPATSYLTWPTLGAIVVTDVKYSDLLNGTVDLEVVSIPGESDSNKGNLGKKDTGTNYLQYAGTWAVADIGWVYGGQILDITANGDSILVSYEHIGSAPFSRVASVTQTIQLSDIQNGFVSVPFDNDGWGHSGIMKLTFSEDTITCEVRDLLDLPESQGAQWGFYEGTYLLIRNDHAHETMEYELSDYEEMFPDENIEDEDDGIPYVNVVANILGQQYTSWNGENPILGSDLSQQYLNDLDDVTYYCYFNWDTQDSSASYEAYGVKGGFIVAYVACFDDFSPKVNSYLTSDFDGTAPKTITNGVFNHHIWRIDNGYFVCCAYYNGPLVKTKREKVIVNQEFPNGYDLYCSLSRKK